jgi:hypothetical protein
MMRTRRPDALGPSNSKVRPLSEARPSSNPTGPGSHAEGQGFCVAA